MSTRLTLVLGVVRHAFLQIELQEQPLLALTLKNFGSLTTCIILHNSSFETECQLGLGLSYHAPLEVLVFELAFVRRTSEWLQATCNRAQCQNACHGAAGQESCGEQICKRDSARRSWSSSNCHAGQWRSQALHGSGQDGVMQEQPPSKRPPGSSCTV